MGTREAVQSQGLGWERAAGPVVIGQGLGTPGPTLAEKHRGSMLHTLLLERAPQTCDEKKLRTHLGVDLASMIL